MADEDDDDEDDDDDDDENVDDEEEGDGYEISNAQLINVHREEKGARGEEAAARRAAKVKRRDEKRKLAMDHQEVIKNYYNEGNYHGDASAFTMYNLASLLECSTNDFLWYAIVGHTENYVDDKIDIIKYEQIVEHYQVLLSLNYSPLLEFMGRSRWPNSTPTIIPKMLLLKMQTTTLKI